MKTSLNRIFLVLLFLGLVAAPAADITLSPNTLTPQTGDDALYLARRQAAALARIAAISRSTTIATAQTTLNSSTATSIAALNTARQSILIRNTDASISIYIGAVGVTSSTGLILRAGETVTIHSTAALYAISASGTPVAYTFTEND